jgi:hypothetical protein
MSDAMLTAGPIQKEDPLRNAFSQKASTECSLYVFLSVCLMNFTDVLIKYQDTYVRNKY